MAFWVGLSLSLHLSLSIRPLFLRPFPVVGALFLVVYCQGALNPKFPLMTTTAYGECTNYFFLYFSVLMILCHPIICSPQPLSERAVGLGVWWCVACRAKRFSLDKDWGHRIPIGIFTSEFLLGFSLFFFDETISLW